MDNTPKTPGAFSIIAEQLPKWWNEPSSEGLKGTVEAMIPQDAVDLGLMVAGGPGGKLARKAGVALMGAGASTDAEAGMFPRMSKGLMKFIAENYPEATAKVRLAMGNTVRTGNEHAVAHSPGETILHTSNAPNKVVVAPKLERVLREPVMSADEAFLLHTHPSGGVGPSLADIKTTAAFPSRQIIASPARGSPFISVDPITKFTGRDYDTYMDLVNKHFNSPKVREFLTDKGYFDPEYGDMDALASMVGPHDYLRNLAVQDKLDYRYNGLGMLDVSPGEKVPFADILESYWREFHPGSVKEPLLKAEGGSVQRPMEHTRSSGQDSSTQPLSGSALKALVRGWMAGTAGLPGDLEGLARTVDKYTTLNPAIRQLKDTTPVLPTADFYKEWLPGKQQGDEVISDIGSLFGGVGATKPVALGKGALSRIAAATPAPRAGSMAAQRGVIKAPGGNWLSGSVEDALKGLKQGKHAFTDPYTPEQVAEMEQYFMANPGKPGSTLNLMGAAELMDAKKKLALNAFVDKQLRNYVRNDMATERDPIRALAESWATAKPQKLAEAQARIDALTAKGQELAATRGVPQEYLTSHRQDVIAAEKAKELIELRQGLHFQPEYERGMGRERAEAGFPSAGLGQSDPAKLWENVSDAKLDSNPIDTIISPRQMESWMATADPKTPLYKPRDSAFTRNLGFDHLMDELRNAVNPESGLPKELLFNPAHMGKITVPQAVERVADINAWRAAQKAEADMARANNAATVLHKDYPEKGMKWVELKKQDQLPEGWQAGEKDPYTRTQFTNPKGERTYDDPTVEALRDALKYEGDTMKHCVGGYCDKVADGSTRIYSLRDAKGRPHVTVEVAPPQTRAQVEAGMRQRARARDFDPEDDDLFDVLDAEDLEAPRILQIKGPSNKKPNDEYLPFVQDFVRSGKWSDVGDFQNTGLRRATDAWNTNEEKMIRAAGIDFPTYATQQEIDAINQQVWPGVMGPTKPPGYAEGGSVTAPTWQDAFNEFDKAHRAEFDIGIDRPWAKDADSVAAKQRIDQRYIDSLKAYDPTLTPDQSVLGANVQPNAYQPKPEGGGWFSQQLSNIGNIFRPVTSSIDDFGKDVKAGAGGVVNEAAQLASEATGGIVSPDAAKVIAAIAYAVATGDPAGVLESGATDAEIAAAMEGATTGASFAWTPAIAESLGTELFSTSPYISEFGSATLGDAALAGATGGGSQIGYNLANVGQTVDEINNASRLSNFMGGQTQNLFGNTASSVAGPFGPVVNVGRSMVGGAPIGKAVTNAVGSAALGKAVQGVSKATGIPSVVVGSGANYGITGNAPQASDIAKAAISLYAADKAKQNQPKRPTRRA